MTTLPFDPNAIEHVYVSYSGGKDSTASLLRCLEIFPPEKITAVFGDTGAELPDAYDYMRWFDKTIFPVIRGAQRITGNKTTVRNGRETEENELENVYLSWDDPVGAHDVLTLKDLIRQRKERRPDAPGWPSAYNRYCTKALKSQVVDKYIRHQTFRDTKKRMACLYVLGIRRGESKNRENTPDYEFNPDLPIQQWYPVASWTAEDVVRYVAVDYGIPLSPVYRHVGRANCGICFFSSRQDVINVARAYPGYLDDYIDIEQDIENTWTADVSLEDILIASQKEDEPQPYNLTLPLFEEPLTCMTGHCDMGGGTIQEQYLWTPEKGKDYEHSQNYLGVYHRGTVHRGNRVRGGRA